MYLKLTKAIDYPMTINLVVESELGGRKTMVRKPFRFVPDKKYELNGVTKMSIEKAKHKIRYSAEAEEHLKSLGVPYEIVTCKACGGRVKKLEFPLLEVADDE